MFCVHVYVFVRVCALLNPYMVALRQLIASSTPLK